MKRVFTIPVLVLCSILIMAGCGDKGVESGEPTVTITYPADGGAVYEVVEVTADARDNKGITRVEFYINDVIPDSTEAIDIQPPYSYSWNTLSLPDSSTYTIYAKAYDTDGNIVGSRLITVMVNHSLIPTKEYEGITQTDEYGQIISEDPDDWQWDDQSGLVDGGMKPKPYRVYPAYPNPAFFSTAIRFALPQTSDVELWIINTRGQTINELVVGCTQAGAYAITWDLKDKEGNRVTPGIYRCIFKANGFESYGDIEVKEIEPTCSDPSSYKSFADAHWDMKKYRSWEKQYVSATGDTLLYILPSSQSEEYYAMIGIYDQCVFGWDDCPEDLHQEGGYWKDVISVNRQTYLELWEDCH